MVTWQNNPFCCIVYDFYLGFSVRQDYSTHFEPSQGVNMRDPQDKNLTTRKQNLAYLTGSLAAVGEMSDIEPGPRSRIKTF